MTPEDPEFGRRIALLDAPAFLPGASVFIGGDIQATVCIVRGSVNRIGEPIRWTYEVEWWDRREIKGATFYEHQISAKESKP